MLLVLRTFLACAYTYLCGIMPHIMAQSYSLLRPRLLLPGLSRLATPRKSGSHALPPAHDGLAHGVRAWCFVPGRAHAVICRGYRLAGCREDADVQTRCVMQCVAWGGGVWTKRNRGRDAPCVKYGL
ncbi:hypothetical protein J3F83DRAFT_751640, partial [Trichoderma novae-zelandiae]